MDSAPRPHYQVTFGILAVSIGAFAPLQSLVIPVLSTIQVELHTSQSAVTWVLTAYLLSASVMTPILGRVGDIYGKKWVFVAALVALAVGSVLAAMAPNLAVLIVARVIQGLGGGTLPLGFGIIRDEFPAGKVAGAVGILAALTAVGGSLGIVLAGPIVNALNWHWLFWLPGIATVIAAVGAVLFVPQSPIRSPGTISWLPAVLLSGWVRRQHHPFGSDAVALGDALIDELVRLSLCEALAEARQALACPGGDGLEQFLRGLGALFAAHAKYAHLLLERSADGPTAREIRAAVQELTSRALAAGTLNPGVTFGDVMALIWGMSGLTETTGEVAPGTWQRFLDIHLAGLRTPGPVSATPSMSAGQLAKLLPRP